MSDLDDELNNFVKDFKKELDIKLLDAFYIEAKKNILNDNYDPLEAVMEVITRAYVFPEILRAMEIEEFFYELIGQSCSMTARTIIESFEIEIDQIEIERISAAIVDVAKKRMREATEDIIKHKEES